MIPVASFEFFVRGKPIPKGSHRAFVHGGRAVVVDIQGQELKRWQNAISNAVRDWHVVEPFSECEIEIDCVFNLPHPKYHYTPKGNKSKAWTTIHRTKPDRDKLLRAVQDALTGIVYWDDSQVSNGKTEKRYTPDGDEDGVFISIRVGERGL